MPPAPPLPPVALPAAADDASPPFPPLPPRPKKDGELDTCESPPLPPEPPPDDGPDAPGAPCLVDVFLIGQNPEQVDANRDDLLMDLLAGPLVIAFAVEGLDLRQQVARGGDMVQHPGRFPRREQRVDAKAGAGDDERVVARGDQGGRGLRGAAALPDNGVVNRSICSAIPDDCGFSLIGDADGAQFPQVAPLRGQLHQRGGGRVAL